jgi:hypothetical protein
MFLLRGNHHIFGMGHITAEIIAHYLIYYMKDRSYKICFLVVAKAFIFSTFFIKLLMQLTNVLKWI